MSLNQIKRLNKDDFDDDPAPGDMADFEIELP